MYPCSPGLYAACAELNCGCVDGGCAGRDPVEIKTPAKIEQRMEAKVEDPMDRMYPCSPGLYAACAELNCGCVDGGCAGCDPVEIKTPAKIEQRMEAKVEDPMD